MVENKWHYYSQSLAESLALWLMQQLLAVITLHLVCSEIMVQKNNERKRHDLKEEELQRARDKINDDRMERVDFINKRLREKKLGKSIYQQC